MADVGKVQGHCILDDDLLAVDTQSPHQLPGVLIGSVRGAEAGHGDTVDIGSGTARLTHGLHGYQQSQRGIQTAGNANNGVGTTNGRKTLLQTRYLELENLLAIGVSRFLGGGNEGQLLNGIQGTVGAQLSAQTKLLQIIPAVPLCRLPEGGVFPPLRPDDAQVTVLDDHVIGIHHVFIFLQNGAAFGDNTVAGVYQIRGGLGAACGAKGINTLAIPGMDLDLLAAALLFAHLLGRCCQVQDHLGAAEDLEGRGRNGCEEILANFDTHSGISYPVERIRAHGVPLAQQGNDPTFLQSRKPAAFVEATIIRQIGLGHQSPQLARRNDGGAVEQLHLHSDRQSHHSGQVGVFFRGFQQLPQSLLHGVVEGFLIKQVTAGVAGHGKLRE